MKKIDIEGVYKDKKQIFTENLDSAKGIKVYNERVVKRKNKEYRSWNPYRSKLAAAILNNFKFDIKKEYNILYLGAATGTTVSHISDIVKNGAIYSVESSPISMKKLLETSKKRQNLIPILENANHPERYSTIVPKVDLIYQDISQKNQAEIFISNASRFLKNNCYGILVVKARSIDVSLKPEKVYEIVSLKLKKEGFIISNIINLSPYEKDHALIKVRR